MEFVRRAGVLGLAARPAAAGPVVAADEHAAGRHRRAAPGPGHAQALALARTRDNQCDPHDTDLTRELRQQKLILAMKSQILSFSGFIRWPWIAWQLPRTIEPDMGAPTLAGVLASLELDGQAHSAILDPTGAETLPGIGDVLTITPSAVRRDVARFMDS